MSAASATSSGSSPASSTTPARKDDSEVGGYRAIFGKDGKPVPKWLPVVLLAFSTVAMSVPIVMLRRHRAANLGKALADAPPPPTRRSTSVGIPIADSKAAVPPSRPPPPRSTTPREVSSAAVEGVNGPLHGAKAFGIATLLVGLGASTTVWGVKRYMGVETTQEFADRMRLTILNYMPILSSRIHRPPAPEDDDASASSEPGSDSRLSLSDTDVEEWTWSAAEQRLKEAFDKDGFSGWAAAMLRELEAEGRLERSKRGHV
ncbi:hypothetical protein C8Q79DRAFT_1010285 [Trametes meyenii]|nr:hypothetical protein C8Q79DRAFT_1010285 [Trametes meyenii]